MKVLITGVTGQLGSYMAEYLLLNTDHEIVGCVRRTSQLIDSNLQNVINDKRFKLVNFDLCDPLSIKNVIKEERPDFFINFGAQSFVGDSWNSPALHLQTNATSLIHILESVREFCPNCRVYSSGSSEQFGDVDYYPQDIKHPFKPRSPYGVSKCAAHHIVKVWRESYDMYIVQGILFNNESERRQKYFVTRKISQAVVQYSKDKSSILSLGNVNARRDWSHSVDFVDGVWKMLNQNKTDYKDYVLASGVSHSIKDFVELAFQEIGVTGKWHDSGVDSLYIADGSGDILVDVDENYYRPAEVELLVGDSTPARQELGWTPLVDFPNLVKRMVQHDLRG